MGQMFPSQQQGPPPQQGGHQAQSLPFAIQAIHAAIAEHPDPQAKQTLTVCLQNMLKVQAQDMQGGQQQGGQ